uniref:Uncharacterized protein n=1 Tax=Anguilla anguilla TaxID=7936 RepID=A0A0E9VRL6_ANGAN
MVSQLYFSHITEHKHHLINYKVTVGQKFTYTKAIFHNSNYGIYFIPKEVISK